MYDLLNEMKDMQNALQAHILGRPSGLLHMSTVDKLSIAIDSAYFLEEELHEMGREIPYIKPWKRNYTVDDNWIILAQKEYIDAWHFMLNLLLLIGSTDDMYIPAVEANMPFEANRVRDITCSIMRAAYCLLDNIKTSDKINNVLASKLIHNMLILASMLNLSADDIYRLYCEKNKINHERQNNNY